MEWKQFKNILCIRLDSLGDVLMTTPAIRALKESVPQRNITLLTSSSGAAIARYIPEVDEIIEFDCPWEKNLRNQQQSIQNLIATLQKKAFDAAVIFTVYSQNPLSSAMICYLAQIPVVAAYCRENPYHLISHWLPDKEPLYEIKHEVIRQLDLVKSLGASVKHDDLAVTVSPIAKKNTLVKLRNAGVEIEKPWLIIHAGASEAKRRYPLESLAEAAAQIADELDYQLLLTGVESEKNLADYIANKAGAKAYNLAGKLNIGELIALIQLSPLLISNNTGPVHIAAAVKTPVIVLYALTNPQHTPWKVKHSILPFDIPEEMRSKNTIIRYAHDKSFKNVTAVLKAEDIIIKTKEMLLQQHKMKKKIHIHEKNNRAHSNL